MRAFGAFSWSLAVLLALGGEVAVGGDRFDGIDPYVEEAMRLWGVPGLAIAVVKDGEIVFARGYGVSSLAGGRAVTKDTVFPIASCTKSFTAACIGMLVDEGRVRWDDPVRKHVEGFELRDPYVSREATLRDLLCHRTGLVRGDLLFVKGDMDDDEVLRRVRFLGQAAPFRTRFTYSNVLYGVLGEVVREAGGMPWDRFVARRILEPLGLESTFTGVEGVPRERLAVRHEWRDGRVVPVRESRARERVPPAGAVLSTAADMARWLGFQLREGEAGGRRLLEPATVREMHALHCSIPIPWRPDCDVYDSKIVGLGLGWFVREYRGRKVVAHGGGWGAETAIVPEERLGVVVLSNLDHNLLVALLVCDVLDAYLVGPERAWQKADKWDRWLALGGPDRLGRARDEELRRLERTRVAGTKPSLPLEEYAGDYESELYGLLAVRHEAGRLSVRFGDHGAELSHWQGDTFHARAVVEPFLDWLVTFGPGGARSAGELEVVHVGWKDPDERHIFRRGAAGSGGK